MVSFDPFIRGFVPASLYIMLKSLAFKPTVFPATPSDPAIVLVIKPVPVAFSPGLFFSLTSAVISAGAPAFAPVP